MSTQKSASPSIWLPSILTIVFVVLKLTHVIDWSWWWVVSPALISAGLGVAALSMVLLAALIAASIKR